MPHFESPGQMLLFLAALVTLAANHFLSGVTLSPELMELLAVIEAILGIIWPTLAVEKVKSLLLFWR